MILDNACQDMNVERHESSRKETTELKERDYRTERKLTVFPHRLLTTITVTMKLIACNSFCGEKETTNNS